MTCDLYYIFVNWAPLKQGNLVMPSVTCHVQNNVARILARILARSLGILENFMSSFGRLRQNIAPKSVPHVQHDYLSSFNQSNH